MTAPESAGTELGLSYAVNQIATCVYLAALVILGSSSLARATTPNAEDCVGHSTPAKSYRAFSDAVNRNDWRTAYRYVSYNSRSGLYAKLIAGLIVASAFDDNNERRAGLDRILRQHGFKIAPKGRYTQADQDISTIVQDWPGLMQEIAPYLKRWHGKTLAPKEGKLRNVRTVGNQATGATVSTGAPVKTVAFVRGPAGWCLTTK